MVTSGRKTAADVARLFGVHASTVGRIVDKARQGSKPAVKSRART
jgi:transposase-like protein